MLGAWLRPGVGTDVGWRSAPGVGTALDRLFGTVGTPGSNRGAPHMWARVALLEGGGCGVDASVAVVEVRVGWVGAAQGCCIALAVVLHPCFGGLPLRRCSPDCEGSC